MENTMESTSLTLILGLSSILLGLSVIVQTLQEIYKYFSNSKSRAYSNAMRSYMGSIFSQVLQSSTIQDTRVQGPFQIFRYRPKNYTLPIDPDQLQKALYSSLSVWKKRAYDALKLESQIQNGAAASPSVEWRAFLTDLSRVPRNTQSAFAADDVVRFLTDWQHSATTDSDLIGKIDLDSNVVLDAKKMLTAFDARFFSQHRYYLDNYSSFNKAFDFQYRRRNSRHSVLIAILLTVTCNLPIQEVYKAASGMDESQAMALADQVMKISQQESHPNPPGNTIDTTRERSNGINTSRELIDAIKKAGGTRARLFDVQSAASKVKALFVARDGKQESGESWKYLFGCFITAILISFGAPVLNDVVGTIVRLKRGDSVKEEKEVSNGSN